MEDIKMAIRRIEKHALYKGKRIMIETASDEFFYVLVDNGNSPLAPDFFFNQKMQERYIYYGQVRLGDPQLHIEEGSNK